MLIEKDGKLMHDKARLDSMPEILIGDVIEHSGAIYADPPDQWCDMYVLSNEQIYNDFMDTYDRDDITIIYRPDSDGKLSIIWEWRPNG